MAITYFKTSSLLATTVTNSNTTLFTMPANPSTAVGQNLRMRFTNILGAAALLTIYNVAAGGTAGGTGSTTLAKDFSVTNGLFFDSYVGTLEPGASIIAISGTASAFSATVLGGTFNS